VQEESTANERRGKKMRGELCRVKRRQGESHRRRNEEEDNDGEEDKAFRLKIRGSRCRKKNDVTSLSAQNRVKTEGMSPPSSMDMMRQ
jgi:hypothetical protein